MKFLGKLGIALSVLILASAAIVPKPSSKLVKAFAALEIHNYFAAKDLFYKAMKKDTLASGYGLSIIYARNNNPFYNLDSAFKYVQLAKQAVPSTESDKWTDLAILQIDSNSVFTQEALVDSCFYAKELENESIESWEKYIGKHISEPHNSNAIERRNALAYSAAESANTAEAFLAFMNRYPEAKQVPDAHFKYEIRLYEEWVADGKLISYQDFIATYPENPYRREAELRIYELSTMDGMPASFYSFIQENPENPAIPRAWRRIYELEVTELTTESLAAFTMKYPEYPFMEEVNMEFTAITTPFYPIVVDDKWGFIDDAGQVQISCQYDWVDDFSENMAAVGLGDEVLFINKNGDKVIDLGLEDAYAFKMGYVVVEKDGYSGVLNRVGEWVLSAEYDEVGEYSEGLFYAEKNGLFGYLDSRGEIVIPFKYQNATDFKNGGAVVENAQGMGVITMEDQPMTAFGYNWIEPFSANGSPSRFKVNEKFGLINQSGREVVPAVYDRIGDWSDTLALAASDEKYGFIDFRGDTIIPFKYTYDSKAYNESKYNGAYVKVFQGDKVAIIDTAGTKIYPAIFQEIGLFEDSLIAVKKRGKWGYADLDVNLAIPYNFDWAGPFVDSSAVVKVKDKYGLIDRKGNWILQPSYVEMKRVANLIAVSDTTTGMITTAGNILVPLIYKEVKAIDHRVIRLEHENGAFDYFDYQRQKFIWRQNDNQSTKE